MKSTHQEELVSLDYGTEVWIPDLSPNFGHLALLWPLLVSIQVPEVRFFSWNVDIGQKVVKFQRRIELYAINMVICGFDGKPKVFFKFL